MFFPTGMKDLYKVILPKICFVEKKKNKPRSKKVSNAVGRGWWWKILEAVFSHMIHYLVSGAWAWCRGCPLEERCQESCLSGLLSSVYPMHSQGTVGAEGSKMWRGGRRLLPRAAPRNAVSLLGTTVVSGSFHAEIMTFEDPNLGPGSCSFIQWQQWRPLREPENPLCILQHGLKMFSVLSPLLVMSG